MGAEKTSVKEKIGLVFRRLKLELRRVRPKGRKVDSGEIAQTGRMNK